MRGETPRFDRDALRALYEELLTPWEKELLPVVRLVVVPSGSLRGIPFELLLMADVDPAETTSLPFLALRYIVTYEPTLGTRLLWASAPDSGASPAARLDLVPGRDAAPIEIPPGTLAATGASDPAARFGLALRLARGGARGALLGTDPAVGAEFLDAFELRRAAGRRADASAVRALYRSARPDSSGSVERFAHVSLFGSP
jgi:hypothetical protein